MGAEIAIGAAGGAAGNAAIQIGANALSGRPLGEGVAQAAVEGAIVGGVTAAVIGIGSRVLSATRSGGSSFTDEETAIGAPVAYADFSGLKGTDADFIRSQIPKSWDVQYKPFTSRGEFIEQWIMTSPDGIEQLRIHRAIAAFGETGFQARWGIKCPGGLYSTLCSEPFQFDPNRWLYFNNRGVPVHFQSDAAHIQLETTLEDLVRVFGGK
ncbi:MAG: hypothetical protein AAB658_12675 [Chloroflexota bacterium]